MVAIDRGGLLNSVIVMEKKEARRRRAEGATLKQLAKSYNVGKSTISRIGV